MFFCGLFFFLELIKSFKMKQEMLQSALLDMSLFDSHIIRNLNLEGQQGRHQQS